MAPKSVSCGLCGAAFSRPYFISINKDAEKGPGLGQPRVEDMEWLGNARILYRSTEFSRTFRRANLSSIATQRNDGKFQVTGNLPYDEFENTDPDGLKVFQTTLRSYHDEKFRMYQGKIEYGQIASQHHQSWFLTVCTKAFAYNPLVASPELQQYYENLPEVKRNRDEREGCKARYLAARDPFGNLPAEILTMILVQLPLQSIGQLRLASAVIVDLQLSGSFWKKKLKFDMPWLWDFPYQTVERSSKRPDWLQIYNDIQSGSEGNGKRPFLSLANRRRIWRICEQIEPRLAQFQMERDMVDRKEKWVSEE
ncbi:uncharacterized protein N7496_012443 [Penicillium cataractarum]|uniref:F-box domain-containing protein n=1 Tax=Penicillium cataractarum TaxID=2100454 RepID=A0A9W9R7V3_9EURO|nr:uncharacterized protein N7496_012443 [Penicillium cataractarum]KAJ5355231.1 hypothetical protein N7496_012443 [Penicillium cataractarum]